MKERFPKAERLEGKFKRAVVENVVNLGAFINLVLQAHKNNIKKIKEVLSVNAQKIKRLEEVIGEDFSIKAKDASKELNRLMPGMADWYNALVEKMKDPVVTVEQLNDILVEIRRMEGEINK